MSPALIFTGTIFLSAALLFFVQPLYAKLVLPVLGGAPAVWTTAMLFFQTTLIAGYLYAHLMIRYVPPKAQVAVHLALWAAALLFLPLALPTDWAPDPDANVALQTLTVFALGVGAPFAVLSANAPLLQAWYGRSDGPSAGDPYFLYAASNLGSLIALMSFPLVAEPFFGAGAIGQGFAIGFFVLGVGLLASGALALKPHTSERTITAPTDKISIAQVCLWLTLAFVPSSMMLAVTSKISTDVGAIPLIWVVPLALYLLTFVIAFREKTIATSSRLRVLMLPALVWLGLTFAGKTGVHLTILDVVGLLGAYFVLALYAHRRLYEARPSGAHLTAFYLIMSVGGALGGLFNSIVAPNLFDTLLEGSITTFVAAGLLLSAKALPSPRQALVVILYSSVSCALIWWVANGLALGETPLLTGLIWTLAALSAVVCAAKLIPTVLAAALILMIGQGVLPDDKLFQDRSFFGVHRVVETGPIRKYINGTTLHGQQFVDDLGAERPRPLAYYHENGPLAAALLEGPGVRAERVGVVGLGVGALACYARPGQAWHFYEIDPVVDRVARDPDLFTFVSSCTPNAPTHLGDARRVLADQDPMRFDVLHIDAYSSDAVPVHLTTVEAMELYMSHVQDDGLLVFHISNRYFDIALPLAEGARHLGLSAGIMRHAKSDAPGDNTTVAVFVARDAAHFGALAEHAEWSALDGITGPLWTDDYANPLAILKWRQ